jgi:leucyl-tRNA---protein transferase
MSNLADLPLVRMQFYVTAPYHCSYLPQLTARSQVATPLHKLDTATYHHLVQLGFRRSGHFVYRPHCSSCQACIPVRVPVARFQPNRLQRRVWRDHQHLTAHIVPFVFQQEHFALYQRYQQARHAGGGMDEDSSDQYQQYLLQSSVHSSLIEFREAGVLRMVSIIDCLPDGLSSVYTFFDPESSKRSYGSYGILWQIAYTAALGLPQLYLGYWVEGSPKMAYKINYQPNERLQHGYWTTQP